MGSEGSINSMLITLKNNKNLLIKRKNYFDRKRSHKKLKRIYSVRLKDHEKTLTESDRQEIRDKLRKDFRRALRVKVFVFSLLLLSFFTAGYYFTTLLVWKTEEVTAPISEKQRTEFYEKSISQGIQSLKDNKPFIAIGHFENALISKPNDGFATGKLIESYELLCEKHQNSCDQVAVKIDSLNNVEFTLPN